MRCLPDLQVVHNNLGGRVDHVAIFQLEPENYAMSTIIEFIRRLRRLLGRRRAVPESVAYRAEVLELVRAMQVELPSGTDPASTTLRRVLNRSYRNTGSNDYTESEDYLTQVVSNTGVEHIVDLDQSEWAQLSTGLWCCTVGAFSYVAVAHDALPVTLRIRHYWWTGDQGGGCDGHSDDLRDVKLELLADGTVTEL